MKTMVCGICLLMVGMLVAEEGWVCHVDSRRGDDAGDGTEMRPFRTARRARDAIRALKKEGRSPAAGVRVEFTGVFDSVDDGIVLGADDGGESVDKPVVYAASREGASFLGARRLPAAGFRPVADAATRARLRAEVRDKVLQFDLRSVGLDRFAPLPRQFEAWRYEELYAGTKTMTLARYPNKGWLEIQSVVDHGWGDEKLFKPGQGGCAVRPGTFEYAADEAFARWDVSKGIYMHGYWCWEWSTESLRVDGIDALRRHVRLGGIHRYGIGCPWKNYEVKRRYFVYNLLEELDAPGEWYIDRPNAQLYCIPENGDVSDMKLAVRSRPLIEVKGARHVAFEGLGLSHSVGKMVEITDAEDCTIAGCELGHGSGGAVYIHGGRRCTVRDSRIHDFGFFGVKLEGGDRRRLAPCGHRVTGCDIGHVGRRIMNGGVCVNVGGCGIRIDHNYLHDVPYIALNYGGNEHLIEFNEIAFAMMEAGDGGGIYSGRDWASRGNVVRCNYLHHFGAAGFAYKKLRGETPEFEPLAITRHGMLMGVYLDDCDSGDTVTNNLFHAAGCGLFVGGGRDNKMRDNIVMAYDNAAYIDTRGRSVIDDRPGLDPSANNGWNMLAKAERWDYTNEPWASRYPDLVRIRSEEPKWPVGTEFTGNVAVGCKSFMNARFRPPLQWEGLRPDLAAKIVFRDNITLPESLLAGVDPKKVQDLPEFRKAAPHFPRIPVEQIGLPAHQTAAVDLVDPMIGAITGGENRRYGGHGLGKTFPGAATPFGMAQLSPDTITGGDNGPGYSYHHRTIEGFSFTHMSGIGWYGDMGNFQVMPTTGPRCLDREKACSPFDHANEIAKAGYYAVDLARYGVRAEMTAAPHSGILRFTYPAGEKRRIQIDLGRRIGQNGRWLVKGPQSVRVVGDRAIAGRIVCTDADGGWGHGHGKVNYTLHYYAEFSEPFAAFGVWDRDRVFEGVREYEGVNTGFFAEFAPATPRTALLLKAGISYVSEDGARANLLQEIPAFAFGAVRAKAHDAWAEALDRVRFRGGTARERTIFATALYHAHIDPRALADCDGRYAAPDGRIYRKEKFMPRTVFSGWDVFRSAFPLYTVIRPDLVSDTINSMMRWSDLVPRPALPAWDLFGCLSNCMGGAPLVSVIADAHRAGIRTYDVRHAYELVKRTLEAVPLKDGVVCGSLSASLDDAYYAWCAGRLAAALGETDDVRMWEARARNYAASWSSEVGWMRAHGKDGKWMPWKGRTRHGQGCVESNPYQSAWFVPHDVEGLAALMGGREKCADELEAFFNGTPPDFIWNDCYNHANEPVHQAPFMFAYLGRPWLVQKWTRRICAGAYGADVYGLCGNEDVGQMSAWYVLAASGLHPVCPGSGVWILTSPLFAEVTFRLDQAYATGRSFTVRAAGTEDPLNVYIRSAKLNGRALDRAWITSDELLAGGVLELSLGPEPDKGLFVRLPPVATP